MRSKLYPLRHRLPLIGTCLLTIAGCADRKPQSFDKRPEAHLQESAANFTFTDLQGRPVKLGGYSGRVVLLDFWATWCAPCIRQIPELNRLHATFQKNGFTVLGVSIDNGGAETVRRFLATNKLAYPVAIDSAGTSVHKSLGIKSIPAVFLIDRTGRIIRQWSGEVDPDDLRAAVVNALQ